MLEVYIEFDAHRAIVMYSVLLLSALALFMYAKWKRWQQLSEDERLRAARGSLKAEALTRAQVASMHTALAGSPFTANRFLAVVSKMFSCAEGRGLVPEAHVNTAGRIERYKEPRHERFLNSEELARLGDALSEAETIGLPYAVDESKPAAKHAPKPENRRRPVDAYAVAAIRLLILTGARLREILHAAWSEIDFERGVIFLGDSKTGKKAVYLSAAALVILSTLPRVEGNPFVIPDEGSRPLCQ